MVSDQTCDEILDYHLDGGSQQQSLSGPLLVRDLTNCLLGLLSCTD